MTSTRAAWWSNSKASNRDNNTTFMIFLYCHFCWSLSWYNYWRSLFRLKLTVQIHFALNPYNPFLITNRIMTGNSVEEHRFLVLNINLQVKLGFKTFYWLLILIYNCFLFEYRYQYGLLCLKFLHILAISVWLTDRNSIFKTVYFMAFHSWKNCFLISITLVIKRPLMTFL